MSTGAFNGEVKWSRFKLKTSLRSLGNKQEVRRGNALAPLQAVNSKMNPWELLCLGPSCYWLVGRKRAICPLMPTHSHYPSDPRNNGYLAVWLSSSSSSSSSSFFFFSIGHYFSPNVRRKPCELNQLVFTFGQRFGVSFWSRGVGMEIAEQQQWDDIRKVLWG
jgi:hypothetical protein